MRTVPHEILQIDSDRMKRTLVANGFDSLAGHIRRDRNVLVMQPFGGEEVIVWRPLYWEFRVELHPRRRFLKNGDVSELVVRQRAAPSVSYTHLDVYKRQRL